MRHSVGGSLGAYLDLDSGRVAWQPPDRSAFSGQYLDQATLQVGGLHYLHISTMYSRGIVGSWCTWLFLDKALFLIVMSWRQSWSEANTARAVHCECTRWCNTPIEVGIRSFPRVHSAW